MLFFYKTIIHAELSNQEKQNLFMTHFGFYDSTAMSRLKQRVRTLDPDDPEFDQTFEKLLFGFILQDRCRFDQHLDPKTISVTKLGTAIGSKFEYDRISEEDYIALCIKIGEKILTQQLPFDERFISKHIFNRSYHAYIVDRLKQYNLLSYEAYRPIGLKAEMIAFFQKVQKVPNDNSLSELLMDINIESQEFDLLTMGLTVQWLATNQDKQLYPRSMDEICQYLDLKHPQNEQEAIEFFKTIGKAILLDKILPCYETNMPRDLGMEKIFSEYLIERHRAYTPVSYDTYNAMSLFIELNSMIPSSGCDVFKGLELENPECNKIIAGAMIYLLAHDGHYPLSSDQLLGLCKLTSPASREDFKQFFLKIGSLVYDAKQLPFNIYKFREHFKSFPKIQLEWLEGILPLPQNTHGNMQYVDFQFYEFLELIYHTYPQFDDRPLPIFDIDIDKIFLLEYGFMVYLTSEKGLYPYKLQELYELCDTEEPRTSSEFKCLLLKLGDFLYKKSALPFSSEFLRDNKQVLLGTVSENSFKQMHSLCAPNCLILDMQQFEIIQKLQAPIAEALNLKFEPVTFSYNEILKTYSEIHRYQIGLLIYRMAMNNEYPHGVEELRAMVNKPSILTSLWSLNFFASETEKTEISTTSLNKLFFALGEMASQKKIPFELISIDAQTDLSTENKRLFKQPFGTEKLLKYDEYQSAINQCNII